jgi:hypothetical protein
MVMGLFSAFGNTFMTALVAFEIFFIPIGIELKNTNDFQVKSSKSENVFIEVERKSLFTSN